jgi:NAD(P)-dependent dehydrogenase (short-subunit alcohol dehydrogenase family)
MAGDAKVAMVTGSTLNIGKAIALHLAREGFAVLVTARQAGPGRCMADITDPAQARGLVEEAVRRFGRLDALRRRVVGRLSIWTGFRRMSGLSDGCMR